MARKRRLDSQDEQEDVETQNDVESSRSKKKRVSSAKDEDDTENMEEDELDCSQAPDFPVTSTVSELKFNLMRSPMTLPVLKVVRCSVH